MAVDALSSLTCDSSAEDKADWLEFSAYFDRFGNARLDEAAKAVMIQQEEEEENIAEADALSDAFREDIENEIVERINNLGESYPFTLSDDGETLSLKPMPHRRCASFYILCLVLSHATKSPILLSPPTDASMRDVRKRHFQVFSTLAVAGFVGGPALSLGWPRSQGTSILSVVANACNKSGTGSPKTHLPYTANPAAKDGGIDVLAWKPSPDRPPPEHFCFGQAASGRKWRAKAARDEVDDFLRDFYDVGPQCNHTYVTIIPFRIKREILDRVSFRHGHILDRTRAPSAATRGAELAVKGCHVEEFQNAISIALWLGLYRESVRA